MKKNYVLMPVALLVFGLVAFQKSEKVSIEKFTNKTHMKLNGGQAGFTGAPGEGNCTACHTGSTQNGQTENVLNVLEGITPVTSYVPGESYTVSLQMTSDPARRGFSATALNGSATMAGTFVGDAGIGGTQSFTGGARQYVSHMGTSNTDAQPFWAWTWNAPLTDAGDVTFYVATNKTNDSGTASGDIIYLSTHTITSAASVIEMENDATDFTAGYSPKSNTIMVEFNSLVSGDMYMNLVDLNGKSVFTYDLDNAIIGHNSEKITLPSDLKNGIYVVHYFVGNKAMSANVMIQK